MWLEPGPPGRMKAFQQKSNNPVCQVGHPCCGRLPQVQSQPPPPSLRRLRWRKETNVIHQYQRIQATQYSAQGLPTRTSCHPSPGPSHPLPIFRSPRRPDPILWPRPVLVFFRSLSSGFRSIRRPFITSNKQHQAQPPSPAEKQKRSMSSHPDQWSSSKHPSVASLWGVQRVDSDHGGEGEKKRKKN